MITTIYSNLKISFFGTIQAQLKTLQRAFKNDKENQAYAVDLLFGYMEDKDDPGYQNWRLLIRTVFQIGNNDRVDQLVTTCCNKCWVDQSELRMV